MCRWLIVVSVGWSLLGNKGPFKKMWQKASSASQGQGRETAESREVMWASPLTAMSLEVLDLHRWFLPEGSGRKSAAGLSPNF